MSTFMANAQNVERAWYVLDAAGKTLGDVAVEAAVLLRGKHKVTFTPHVDCGDNVIVINADKVVLTGRKLDQKVYYHHTGYIGGIKDVTLKAQLAEHPERVLVNAVKKMISRNKLGRQQMTKLRVFAGAEHTHAAQNPIVLDIAKKNPKNKRGE